eukprot:TRINITY_DN6653_c0_g1_i1.p1 TRINITY_DN6653_c0_g1~~TRINITY_DN6653_c0_g1_i1.p1  ORF type:complete len:147 (-),score=8.38 TRINITY_DN6653_c0_g1_i1:16-456(-)
MDEHLITIDTPLCRQTLIFFLVYLALDCVMGILHYREHFGFLTGWVHHFGYAALVSWVLYREISFLSGTLFPFELSTIPLSAGYMKKPWRRDWEFGIIFFIIRLVYNAYLMYSFFFFQVYDKVWIPEIGRAVQQECRDRSRMPSSA